MPPKVARRGRMPACRTAQSPAGAGASVAGPETARGAPVPDGSDGVSSARATRARGRARRSVRAETAALRMVHGERRPRDDLTVEPQGSTRVARGRIQPVEG